MKLTFRTSAALLACLLATTGLAQEPGKSLDLGKYKLTAPSGWKQQQPKFNFVLYEFATPATEGDKTDGRLTVSATGGSIEANVERWYGQFKQPDGGTTKERAKVEKRTIAGREVHLFDLSGTYLGQGADSGEQPNYRMLAAIITTPDANFYVKYYGPRKTVTANEKPFKEMIESLSAK